MPKSSTSPRSNGAETRHGKPAPPFGRMLRLLRTVENRTLRELGQEIGVSAATLMRVEQGYAFDMATWIRLQMWMMSEDR